MSVAAMAADPDNKEPEPVCKFPFRQRPTEFGPHVFCTSCGAIPVYTVKVLEDNFSYVFLDATRSAAFVVDPSEAEPVAGLLRALGVPLKGILCTHKHWDHVGGVKGLKKEFPDAIIYGSEEIPFEGMVPDTTTDNNGKTAAAREHTHTVKDGELIDLTPALKLHCLKTPGHTSSHVCYCVISGVGHCFAFTGDTLFLGGCGRMFEGDAHQLRASLTRLTEALSKETLIFCGHEYTAANLAFAKSLASACENPRERTRQLAVLRAVQIYVDTCKERGLPTVPLSNFEESVYNPFLRTADVQQFARIRHLKDEFSG